MNSTVSAQQGSKADAGAAPRLPSADRNGHRRATTVCVLDDDPSVLKATERLLHAAGCEVDTFLDPHAFLEHARKAQPPVVVIDVLMPIMNGLEVQMRLREISPQTRVVVLTSKDDPLVRAKALEGGASAFFLKPADDEEFVSRIRAALHGNSGHAGCAAA